MTFQIKQDKQNPLVLTMEGLNPEDSPVVDLTKLVRSVSAVHYQLKRERNSFLYDDSVYTPEKGFFFYDPETNSFKFENHSVEILEPSTVALGLGTGNLKLDTEFPIAEKTLKKLQNFTPH